VTEARIASALAQCAYFGLEPVLGQAAGRKVGFLAGTDTERLADLDRAFRDPGIAAVWALRGGYGTMRLLAALAPPEHPRLYLGFSDNTAVHLWLLKHGLVAFHGPHAGAELPPLSELCLRRVAFQAEAAGELPLPAAGPPPVTLVPGRAEGRLVGGNLALVAALCGTPWQPSARGRLLFIEDVGEPGYRVDRFLRQLQLAGVLEGVAGLVGGQFTQCGTAEETAEVQDTVREFAVGLGVPAVLGFPIGHDPDNWTLPLGVRARLDADAGTLSLLEPAVEHR
jgi:muramoyltetrapeptide carboxypeptidase